MERKKDVLYKIFASKYAIYIVLAVGILMLLYAADGLRLFAPKPQQTDETQSYASFLEKRMEEILQSIDGVGTVKVMITTKEAIANDRRGVPAVVADATPEVDGVIVIAQGASDATVKNMIHDACIAALSVKPHRVQVFTLKKER